MRAVRKAFWEAYCLFVSAFRDASERLRAEGGRSFEALDRADGRGVSAMQPRHFMETSTRQVEDRISILCARD